MKNIKFGKVYSPEGQATIDNFLRDYNPRKGIDITTRFLLERMKTWTVDDFNYNLRLALMDYLWTNKNVHDAELKSFKVQIEYRFEYDN